MTEQHPPDTPAPETAGDAVDASGQRPAEDALADARERIEALQDQVLRRTAELENFRRRTTEEKAELVRFANEGLILELLGIIDDFDRSLKAGREHPDFESFFRGVELVRGNLMKLLERRGVTPIDTRGQAFDVSFHDALLQIPDPSREPGSIVDEISAGYMLHDRVIRHAKVTVAAPPPDAIPE